MSESAKKVSPTLYPIPGIDGYAADAEGNIWSISSDWRGYGNRILYSYANRYGYLQVRVYCEGKRAVKTVHRLVCGAFHGAAPTTIHEVRHLDGSRSNNRPGNLCWGTRSQNAHDREFHKVLRGQSAGATI